MSDADPLQLSLRALIADVARHVVREELSKLSARDEYLTTRAAGELAKVTPGTIRRWIRERQLAGHRAGRVVRVSRAELERLLQRGGRREPVDMTPEQLARRDFG